MGTLLAVSFWGGRGVSNWVPYWQFHFGEGGGFELGTLLTVSFWGGRGGGTSAGRLVNFDSFSEMGMEFKKQT